MKKIILTSIMFMLFIGVVSASSINGEYKGDSIVKVLSNGNELQSTDVPAILHDGRTLVPLYMLKQIGVELTWDLEKFSVEVKLPKPTTTPIPSPQSQIDTILDFKNYTSAVMDNLKKSGIVLNTYSLNIDRGGLFAYAQYQPDVSSAFAYSKAIASIASAVTILNYPIDGTVIELVVGSTTTGTVGIGVSDTKDYVNNKITLSEFVKKWKNTIYELSNNQKPTTTPAPTTAPSSTFNQNSAACSLINSKYDTLKGNSQADLISRGMGHSSYFDGEMAKIERDRKNELLVNGCAN